MSFLDLIRKVGKERYFLLLNVFFLNKCCVLNAVKIKIFAEDKLAYYKLFFTLGIRISGNVIAQGKREAGNGVRGLLRTRISYKM